jgi:O-antigen/teichoic acid export membrane protein
LTGVGIAVAPLVADFYGEPTLEPLFMLLSCSFALASLGSTHGALLTRELRFRELELTASFASVGGAVVAVVAAVAGAGPWALVLQAAVTSATTTSLLWFFSGWRPAAVVSRASMRKLLGYGANVTGSRVLGYLSRDSDNFLVGRFLGAPALGVYSIAYAVISMPFDRLLAPVQSLLMPMLSRLQDDRPRTREIWLQGMRMCLAVMAPLTAGVAILAPEFVRVVLGERWMPASQVIQVVAYVACIQSLTVLTPLVLAAQFKTPLMLRLGCIAFAAHLVAFIAGLHWGVLGVAVGYAISNTLIAVPLQVSLPARILDASARDVFGSVIGVLQAAVGMGTLVIGAKILTGMAGGGSAARLLVGVFIGAVSYTLFIVWREPRLVAEVPGRLRLPSVVRRRMPVPAPATGDVVS